MNNGLVGYPEPLATARIYNADGPTITNAGGWNQSEVFLCAPVAPNTVQVIDFSTGGGATPPDAGGIHWMLTSADVTNRRSLPPATTPAVVAYTNTSLTAATFTRMSFWRIYIATNASGVATVNVWGAHTYGNNTDTGAQNVELGYGARIRGRGSFVAVGAYWSSNTPGADTMKVHPAISISTPAMVVTQ